MTRTSDVFVPGRVPNFTYNPRTNINLEASIEDFVEESGAILTLAGPTKTGKTVLLRKVLDSPVMLDGQGITSVDAMWDRVADELGLSSATEETSGFQSGSSSQIKGSVNALLAQGGATHGTDVRDTNDTRVIFQARSAVLVRKALQESGRPFVIDDFHFIDQSTQRQIVRALKPLVIEGVPIIFVSISHRVHEVVQAEPDMTGRVVTLAIDYWPSADLIEIAASGFEILNLIDPGGQLAAQMAEQSYGSPHLMQKFCRELCKANGYREAPAETRELTPPNSWPEFYRAQLDKSSEQWATRLIRGLMERGSARTKYQTSAELELDGYGLTLLAMAKTGPLLSMTKDRVREEIGKLVVGVPPNHDQTTRFLKSISKIAAKRLEEELPAEGELENTGANLDVQPVVDYIDEGPASVMHVADPFFALYLAWGLEHKLREEVGNPGVSKTE